MEWDPLLESKGHEASYAVTPRYKSEKGKVATSAEKSLRKVETVTLMLLPGLLFATNTCCWTLLFHKHPFVILCLQLGFLAFSGMTALIFRTANRYFHKLGLLLCMTVCCSFLAGAYVYYKFTIYSFSYADLRVYTNVQATQPSDAFQDSGMVQFSPTSHVDTTRAVGFQSHENAGRVFCIAPVMEQGMSLDQEVGFWAVGTDCCAQRSSFECGWATDPEAHSGVILLKDELIAPQALGWLLNLLSDRPWSEYEHALRQQNAVFGTRPAKNHLLLHWERYPIKVTEDFRRSGIVSAIHFSLYYFILLIILAVMHQKYSRIE